MAAARPKPPAFPTTAELRTIQLATFACSRENGAEACSRARSLADPLMDNPLLPSFCKDTVWSIVQQAEPAATNSFRRRDDLDRAGELLLRRCQQPTAATRWRKWYRSWQRPASRSRRLLKGVSPSRS